MRKKIISLTVIFVLALSASGVALIVTASSDKGLPDYVPIDVGPRLRDSNPTINFDTLEKTSAGGGSSIASDYVEGEEVWGLWYDDLSGLYWMKYTVRAVGTFAEIWVANDLDWADPTNDPRPTPVVTDAQVIYLLSQYDNNIHPTVTDYYGEPDFHDGSNAELGPGYYDENGRTIIMVSNIGDENYYDPTYPSYIAGFYWSLYQDYFDRNIINIDSYDWVNRVGPDGTRPHLYEGTIAHELQHLVHSDYVPGDETFINEGFSLFAEVLCGYGIPWDHINTYLATPDNSLTEWGDQGGINTLADYGAAALFAIYLNDHFGDSFISDFMVTGFPGFGGLNYALFPETFDDVYHDWRIANLIHQGDGRYNYVSIDLGSEDADPIRIIDLKNPVPMTTGSSFGTTITGYGGGRDTGISELGPYGSDYIEFSKWPGNKFWKKHLVFNGQDSFDLPNHWTLTADGWWSDSGDLYNDILAGTVFVDDADTTLTVSLLWDLEDYWDFAFIQVSTDGGDTWTSLENEYTTYDHDSGAHPAVTANLPGLTSWVTDFVTMDFDLSAYAGQEVLIGFRHVTDWNTNYGGLIVGEATVDGVPLELNPFVFSLDVDFKVTVVAQYNVNGQTVYVVLASDVLLDDATEEGSLYVEDSEHQSILMIVSPTSSGGFYDYEFRFQNVNKKDF